MAKVAWGAATVADFASWYVTDDKWGSASNSDWDNVTMSLLGVGAFRAVTMAAGMAVPAVHDMFMPIAAVSLVWELANLYLINNAEGTTASSTNSTNISYACAAVGVLGSAKVTMASMMKGGDDKGDESYDYYYGYDAYYEEKPEDDTKDADDSYGGYGGYSYYGYYY